jgi:hypothetical protein
MMMNGRSLAMPVVRRYGARTIVMEPRHGLPFSYRMGADEGIGLSGPSTDEPELIQISVTEFRSLKDKVKKQDKELTSLKKKVDELFAISHRKQDIQVVVFDPSGRFSKLQLEAQKTPDNFYDFLKRMEWLRKKDAADRNPVEEHTEGKKEEKTEEKKETAYNLVFKKRDFNGLCLDFEKLRDWIENNFVPNICAKYDWFALWRILKDHGFLKDNKTSTFVGQMKLWFGDEQMKGVAAAINLYRSGYLGNYPFEEWKKGAFLEKRGIGSKQSEDGYTRLCSICLELQKELQKAYFYVKEA